MVNPGAFQGARRAFLLSQKPAYAAAVVAGTIGDCIAGIQRRFFKRFPLDMDETEEPSDNDLAAVDDDAPDSEPPAPDEDLPDEEYALEMKAFRVRTELVTYRRKVSIVLPPATNNVKLTHEVASQTLD